MNEGKRIGAAIIGGLCLAFVIVFFFVGIAAVMEFGWDLAPDQPVEYSCELVRSEVL